ncbi:MAG: lipid-binding protein [Bacteroidota bacterium]|nr:lipid-binding protein [Bacteroidota bacterium]
MKKLIILLFAAVGIIFSFTSCDSETEPGGTAVQDMAGDWWVTYEANQYQFYNCYYEYKGKAKPYPAFSADVNGDGVVDLKDLESSDYASAWMDMAGHLKLLTANTAANLPTEMWVCDNVTKHLFWNTQVKVNVDYAAKTFQDTTTTNNNVMYDSNVQIIGGKVLKNAAKTPSGQPADSIIFYVKYNDDYGNDIWYKVSGFRRTGFPADDF